MSGGYNPNQGGFPNQGGAQGGPGFGNQGQGGPGGPPQGGPGFAGGPNQPGGPGYGGGFPPGGGQGHGPQYPGGPDQGAPGGGFGPGGPGQGGYDGGYGQGPGGQGGPGGYGPGGFDGGNQGFPPNGGFGQPPNEGSGKKPWLVPLIIGLAVLLLIGGFLIYWFGIRDSDEPTETSGPSPATTAQTTGPENEPSEPGEPTGPASTDPGPGEPSQAPPGDPTTAPADPPADPGGDPTSGSSVAWPQQVGEWELSPGGDMESMAVYQNASGVMIVFMAMEGLTAEQMMTGQDTTTVDGSLCATEPSSGSNICAVNYADGSLIASGTNVPIETLGPALKAMAEAL